MTTLQIDYYYAEDRIPGAVKMVKTWFFLKTWKSWLTGENEVIHMSQILLLEDDVSLVDGLRYSLKRNGFDITIARTIEEANVCNKLAVTIYCCLMLPCQTEPALMCAIRYGNRGIKFLSFF